MYSKRKPLFGVLIGAFGLLLVSTQGLAASKKPLAQRHVDRGIQCSTCHDAQMPKLKMKDGKEPCVSCHGFYDKVFARVNHKYKDQVNPHDQHDGNLPCTVCHKGHKPGVNYCEECHSTRIYKVP